MTQRRCKEKHHARYSIMTFKQIKDNENIWKLLNKRTVHLLLNKNLIDIRLFNRTLSDTKRASQIFQSKRNLNLAKYPGKFSLQYERVTKKRNHFRQRSSEVFSYNDSHLKQNSDFLNMTQNLKPIRTKTYIFDYIKVWIAWQKPPQSEKINEKKN